MTTQIQWRRGTTAEHSTFTGADGEVTVDTSQKTLVVHDGITAGGHPLDVRLQDYAALRTYAGSSPNIQITGVLATAQPQGIAGQFIKDTTDTTSADNGGTIIVDANGSRWKRVFNGEVNVKWFGATGDGSTDDTAAIQAAINYWAAGIGAVYFPTSEYKVTSTVAISQSGVRLYGDGSKQSVIVFAPTANDTCFSLTKGASVIYNCTVEGLRFAGSTAFKKIALELSDFSMLTVRDIEISGWTGGGSVGIQTKGREASVFDNLRIDADLPIQISNNPNSTIDCNEFTFRDLYLTANDTAGACILADDGVYFSGLTFEGHQAWVHGKYGFYYSNTTSVLASEKISFNNIWKEQSDAAAGYVFYISDTAGNIKGISFTDSHGDTNCNGYYLRGIQHVGWNNCFYPSGVYEALNVDATVINMTMNGFHAESGSTATLTGQTLRGSFLKSASGSPFPDVAWYQSTGASSYAEHGKTSLSGTGTVLKVTGATAADSAQITDGTTDFRVNQNAVTTLYNVSNHPIRFGTNNTSRFELAAAGSLTPFADNTYDFGGAAKRLKNIFSAVYYSGAGAVLHTSGAGSPEGAVTAPIGSTYGRSDGGAVTSYYVKESGTGNTGWVAK